MEKVLCKLTDERDTTYNNTKWGENITHTSSGEGGLCSCGWIHYYDSPLLAVLLNPIHGDFKNPNLWEVKVNGKIKEDFGIKYGTTSLTTIKKIELPVITLEQKIIFGILCAMIVYKDNKFQKWGSHWIDGSNRSVDAAKAAASDAAKAAASYASRAASDAAWAANDAAWAASYAAWAASVASWAAAKAAAWAASVAEEIDLHTIALKAISYKE